LEKLAIPEQNQPKALHQLSTFEHILESAILSTCNRIEVYATVTRFHAGSQDLRNFFAEFCHVAPEEFADHLYGFHDDGAVRHLFRVAAGIDSMIVGESEILGQVRRALSIAQDEGTVGRTLGHAFRQALHVGKRARTETGIGRNPVSVSSAAVRLAQQAFHDRSLRGRRVAIVGAGKMGRLAMGSLRRAGVGDITIVNRTEERAHSLAEEFGAAVRSFDELEQAIARADIVISSTMSPEPVIDVELVRRALHARRSTDPLLLIDIAVPRDVDASVAELDGVIVRGIEDLKGVVDAHMGARLGEISKVEEIVDAELRRFREWEMSTEIAPTIAALVAHADDIRRSELERLSRRLGDLDDNQREAVEQLTRSIVAKMLHGPINRVRQFPASKQGHLYLAALRELYELEDD
jgi:glutamyl-tRNA reductase